MKTTPEIKVLRAIDTVVDMIVFAALIALLVIGGYCIWDNKNIEALASSSEWAVYKPKADSTGEFDKLVKMNPDVIGWLDIYGTNIDYPVLYSPEPDEYLMKDPMGNFSLTGSIFLDSASSPDFSDLETIIYGHHMDRQIMFGPIDDFEDKKFFDEHRYGKLLLRDGREYGLDIWTLVEGDAYDRFLYRRGIKDPAIEADFVSYLASKAVNTRNEVQVLGTDQIVLLSTCAGETTNGRKIVVAKMLDYVPEDSFYEDPDYGDGLNVTQWTIFGLPWYVVGILGVLLLILIFLLYMKFAAERRRKLEKLFRRMEKEEKRIEAEKAALATAANAPPDEGAEESTPADEPCPVDETVQAIDEPGEEQAGDSVEKADS